MNSAHFLTPYCADMKKMGRTTRQSITAPASLELFVTLLTYEKMRNFGQIWKQESCRSKTGRDEGILSMKIPKLRIIPEHFQFSERASFFYLWRTSQRYNYIYEVHKNELDLSFSKCDFRGFNLSFWTTDSWSYIWYSTQRRINTTKCGVMI